MLGGEAPVCLDRVPQEHAGQPGGRVSVFPGVDEVYPQVPHLEGGPAGHLIQPVAVGVGVDHGAGDLHPVHLLNGSVGIDRAQQGILTGPKGQGKGFRVPHALDGGVVHRAVGVVDHRAVQAEVVPVQTPGDIISAAKDGQNIFSGHRLGKGAFLRAVIHHHCFGIVAVGERERRDTEKGVGLALEGVASHGQGVLCGLLRRGALHHTGGGGHPGDGGDLLGNGSPPGLPQANHRQQAAGGGQGKGRGVLASPAWGRRPGQQLFVKARGGGDAVHISTIAVHSHSPFSSSRSLSRARARRERTVPSRQPVMAAISAVW